MNSLDRIETQTDTKIKIGPVIDQKQIELGHDLGDWFVFRDMRHFGPLTTKQIQQFLLARLISSKHHIWRPGLRTWIALKDIETFRACGVEDIEPGVTDNDFSLQAQLEDIDLIRLQEAEIRFHESTMEASFEEKDPVDEPRSWGTSYKILWKKYKNFLTQMGLPESRLLFFNLGLGAFILISSFYMGTVILAEDTSFINHLSKEQKLKILENAQKTKTIINPSVVLIEKNPKNNDFKFIGSVNLPVGSKVALKVHADSNTLVGLARFDQESILTLKHQIFQMDLLNHFAGSMIVPGVYKISLVCLSCQSENLEISNFSYKYKMEDRDSYNKSLVLYHNELKLQAEAELEQLFELNDRILDLFQSSISVYNRAIGTKSLAVWSQFSSDWLTNHHKISDLLLVKNNKESKTKVYYLSLYQVYFRISQELLALHITQDKYIAGSDKSLKSAETISEKIHDLKQKLAYLKSQLDLMKINFKRGEGLPSMEGLRIQGLLND